MAEHLLLSAAYVSPCSPLNIRSSCSRHLHSLLFIDFFVRSYINRNRATSERDPVHKHKHVLGNVEKAGKDAFKGVERQIHEAMADEQGNDDMSIPPGLTSDIKAKAEDAKAGLRKGVDKLAKKAKNAASKGQDAAKDAFEAAKEKGKNAASEGQDAAKDASGTAKEKSKAAKEKSEGAAKEAESKAKSQGESKGGKPEGQATVGGAERDERAYEINPDELKDAGEEEAEKEMQPNGS